MQSAEIWKELVVILGENAPNIELGVLVFRVKDDDAIDIRRPNSKSSNAELRVRTPFCCQ